MVSANSSLTATFSFYHVAGNCARILDILENNLFDHLKGRQTQLEMYDWFVICRVRYDL